MRAILPSILCCALVAACHDSAPPTAPLQSPTPDAPRLSLIATGVTDLGTLGRQFADARDINDFGQIVGVNNAPASYTVGYLWFNGATTEFSGDGESARAEGINNLGRIVGTIGSRAVVWENGTPTQLGGLTAGGSATAYAINERGQIVGYAKNAASNTHAVVWVNSVPTDLGTLGGPSSTAFDINEAGQIVGDSEDAAGQVRPVLWVNGAPIDLGTLGGAHGIASGINDLGQIVGFSQTTAGNVFHATLWQNGAAIDLGTLGGTVDSYASDVNHLGQIVGWSTDAAGASHAVLWMDGSIYELGGVPGATEATAIAINDLGEVVGSTSDFNHVVRWQVVLRAAIDAVPGDAANAIKLAGAGTVNVTVFGSRYFDAAQIDARTVTLGNEDGSDTPAARKKTGQSTATLRDVNRDGYADLSLEFDKKQMTTLGDLSASTTKLVLLGSRLDGRRVRGVDRVTVQ